MSYRARCIGRRNLRALRRRMAQRQGSANSWARAMRKIGERPTVPAGVTMTISYSPHRVTWASRKAAPQ